MRLEFSTQIETFLIRSWKNHHQLHSVISSELQKLFKPHHNQFLPWNLSSLHYQNSQKKPQTFRFCCHWRAEDPELWNCGCLQCCVWAGDGAGWLFLAQHPRVQADPLPWEQQGQLLTLVLGHFGGDTFVQIPWDFPWGLILSQREFSIPRAQLALLSAGGFWVFPWIWAGSPSLVWSSPAAMEALRVAFPLFCIRNFC